MTCEYLSNHRYGEFNINYRKNNRNLLKDFIK